MAIRAVLFDVGGPLDLEVTHERLMDAAIQAALGVDEATYAEANAWAVESFASNAYQAIIWRLLGGHDAERGARIYASLSGNEPPDLFELRPGIPDLLADLRGRGVKLGIVANQPARAVGKLKAAGIADLFDCLGLSALVRLQKPDLRLFLAVCDSLQTLPNECIMVGDRIDNDIAPARQLGMHTVLLRYGRHIRQRPRTWLELADREAHDTESMRSAILALLDASDS